MNLTNQGHSWTNPMFGVSNIHLSGKFDSQTCFHMHGFPGGEGHRTDRIDQIRGIIGISSFVVFVFSVGNSKQYTGNFVVFEQYTNLRHVAKEYTDTQ